MTFVRVDMLIRNPFFRIHFRNKKRVEDELAPLTSEHSQIDRLKQAYQTSIKSEADKATKLSAELLKLDEKSCKCEESLVKAENDLKVNGHLTTSARNYNFRFVVHSVRSRVTRGK